MFEKFGLDEQARMKKDMEERAETFWKMPFVIEETAKEKLNGAAGTIREIEEYSEIGTAISQKKPPDLEGFQKAMAKIRDNPLTHRQKLR